MHDSLTSVAVGASDQQYLIFRLGEETFAVDIHNVREITGAESVTRLPHTPKFIRGVMNLRGAIVPIVDLRRRFDIAEMSRKMPIQVVVILTVKTDDQIRTIGVLVDDVLDVAAYAPEDIKASPDLGSAINTEFLRGIVTQEDDVIVLLEADRLFSLDELSRLDDVGSDADDGKEEN